jgi:RNA polymerase sigma-70 factor (ECF subfamily)
MAGGEPDEARLIEEARRGSERAFAELVRLHQAPVRACLCRYVRGWDVVDDLAQDTFVRAYRALPTFRGEAPLRLWLLSIARNRVLRYLDEESRRRSREGETLESAVARWMARDAEEAPELRERELAALRTCVESLASESGSLLADFYFKNRTAVEIARSTGRKESAVWMALLRLRQALRRCVESRLAGEAHG